MNSSDESRIRHVDEWVRGERDDDEWKKLGHLALTSQSIENCAPIKTEIGNRTHSRALTNLLLFL